MSSTALVARAEQVTKYIGGTISVVKAIEGSNGRKVFTFLATSETVDRDGEIVTAEGWCFAAFDRNPVILDGHNYYSGCKAVVGRAIPPLRRVDSGWEVDVEFAPTDEGKRVETLVDGGFIKAVSVGFMPKKVERSKGEPPRHVEKELLEISIVPIPSNRDALRIRGVTAETQPISRSFKFLDGAKDFNSALAQSSLDEDRWRYYHALTDVLRDIIEDENLTAEQKVEKADASLGQFHVALLAVVKQAVGIAEGGDEYAADASKQANHPESDEPTSVYVVANARGLRVGDVYDAQEAAEKFALEQVNADLPNSPYLVSRLGANHDIVHLVKFDHWEKSRDGVLRTDLATGEMCNAKEPTEAVPAKDGNPDQVSAPGAGAISQDEGHFEPLLTKAQDMLRALEGGKAA